MSKPETPNELVIQIQRLLEKHEVHNEILAYEIAIMVTQRERTMIKRSRDTTTYAIKKAYKATTPSLTSPKEAEGTDPNE